MKLFLLIPVLIFNLAVFGTSIESVQDGNWTDNSTWDNVAPGCYDTIIINHYVLLNSRTDLTACPPLTLIINGTLSFKTGKKLLLPVGSQVIVNIGGTVKPEGGGGSSDLIAIGTVTVWITSNGPVFGYAYTDGTWPLPIELGELTA